MTLPSSSWIIFRPSCQDTSLNGTHSVLGLEWGGGKERGGENVAGPAEKDSEEGKDGLDTSSAEHITPQPPPSLPSRCAATATTVTRNIQSSL